MLGDASIRCVGAVTVEVPNVVGSNVGVDVLLTGKAVEALDAWALEGGDGRR